MRSQIATAHRGTTFTIDGTSQTVTTPSAAAGAAASVTSPSVYTKFTNLIPDGSDQITITAAGSTGGESDVNGFELVSVYPLSLNTNFAATATSTLNIPLAGAQVSMGSLAIAAGSSPTLTINGCDTLTLSNSAGGPAITGSGGSGAAAINSATPIQIASGSVNVDAGASLAINAPIHDVSGGSTTLTKVGGGQLTLGTACNYTGPTNVNAGTLVAGAAGVLSPNSDMVVGTNSMPAALNVAAGTQTVNSLTLNPSSSFSMSIGQPLAVSNNVSLGANSTISVSGTIPPNFYEVLMTYNGTLSGSFSQLFNGGNALPISDLQYFPGAIDVYVMPFSGAGTWLGTANNWNSSSSWTDGNTNGVPGDGTRGTGVDSATFSGSGSTTAINLDITPNLAALNFSGTNYTLSNGSLTMQSNTGTSAVTVNGGTQTVAAAVQIAGGSLQVSASNNSVLQISGNVSDDNGQESLTLDGDGSGELVLSGTNNTYGGGTNVLDGTLVVASAGALLDGSSLTVGADALALGAVVPAAAAERIAAVPEPGTLALLAVAALLCGLAWRRRHG